jgi:Outer membrane protein beta-barrel domain
MHKLTYWAAALLMLLFNLPTNAQHRVGVVGGLNFADAEVEIIRQSADVSSRTLFGLGGVVDLRLSKNFGLHLEPMYLQKGGASKDIQPGVDFRLKSSYVELPIFFKAEFGNTVRPYLMAGPSVAILLRADLEAELGGIVFKGDAKDATESVDFAAAFGAGVSYPLGRSAIFLEGRYFLGFTNNIKGGTFEVAAGPLVEELTWNKETDKLKNRGFQIMAGVTYALGGR